MWVTHVVIIADRLYLGLRLAIDIPTAYNNFTCTEDVFAISSMGIAQNMFIL